MLFSITPICDGRTCARKKEHHIHPLSILLGAVLIVAGVAFIFFRKSVDLADVLTSFFGRGRNPPPIRFGSGALSAAGVILGIFGVFVIILGLNGIGV
jgi:hypothetical protein